MRDFRIGRRGWALLLVVVAVVSWRACQSRVGLVGVGVDWVGGESSIERLFASEESGVVVEAEGVVDRVLADDLEGNRHQRLIVRLSSGHTILISHNIDLAPRVEGIAPGDRVRFRGQYEWNEKGGLVHWTHHDPDGTRPGGWIEHAGETYR